MKLTFTNYGIACWYWQNEWTWAVNLEEVALLLTQVGLRMPVFRFVACLNLLQSGELPAAWRPVLEAAIAARTQAGLSDPFDPVAPMQRLIQCDPVAQSEFLAAGFKIDPETDAPDYYTADELLAMLTFCMLDSRVAKDYAALAALYEPYGSTVNYDWIGRALGVLLADSISSSVYDVGCGSGTGTITMASYQPDMQFVGVERQHPMLFQDERGEAPENVRFIQTDFTQMDTQPVQACVVGAAFGHQTGSAAILLLQKIHDALVPGGYLICSPVQHGRYGGFDGHIAIYQKESEGFVAVDRTDLPFS